MSGNPMRIVSTVAWAAYMLGTGLSIPVAQADDKGNLLQEFAEERCSEDYLAVWGAGRDISVYRGQSDGVKVSNNVVVWFCGKDEQRVACPEGTNFVWISRTESRRLSILCYQQ